MSKAKAASPTPRDVEAQINLHCRYPIERVEILRSGEVVASRDLKEFDGHLAWQEKVAVSRPCWLAARCFGVHAPRYPHSASHNHFAHTNPLVVTLGGKRPSSPTDAARFVQEIDALIAFAPHIPTERLRARSLDAFRKARRYFTAATGP